MKKMDIKQVVHNVISLKLFEIVIIAWRTQEFYYKMSFNT